MRDGAPNDPLIEPMETDVEKPRRFSGVPLPRQRARSTIHYSRFVRGMKILLPAIALVLIALVAVWPHLGSVETAFQIGYSKLSMVESGDPSAVNPRFVGTDKKKQIYTVTADLAKNLNEESPTIELEMPKADITLDDGTWVVVTADNGHIDRADETLELTNDVTVYHDKGYELLTSRAFVYLKDRVIFGDEPVRAQGSFGTINSEGFEVVDMGEVVFFTGRAKVVLYPNSEFPDR